MVNATSSSHFLPYDKVPRQALNFTTGRVGGLYYREVDESQGFKYGLSALNAHSKLRIVVVRGAMHGLLGARAQL